ncbi:MAG: FkbM family methyltransferase [Solirubrobacteraceae bacterium]
MQALRRFFGQPWLLPLTALLLRARTITPGWRFVLRELRQDRSVSVYRLARSDVLVAIRHGSADVVTLGEVFHNHDYVPPAALETQLATTRSVLDLGANVGLFGAFAASRWPGAKIVAFEPDPANLAVLEQTIAANGLGRSWTVVPAAAGAHDGESRFLAGGASLSHLTDDDTPGATTVPIRDVLPAIAQADLVKIDIEGGEWEIFSDPRFGASPPRALVIEYHPYRCPGADSRAAAEGRLRAAGMHVQTIWHRDDGHGMLWAWRS